MFCQVSDAKTRNSTWKINNRLYGPSSVSFADDFVKTSKKHYNYDHSKINFRDKRSAVNSINEWAAKSTDGKLPEITKDVQNPDGAMIVNAMFFKRKCGWCKSEATVSVGRSCRCVTECFLDPQLTGMRDSMKRWLIIVLSWLPALSPLEFPWCTARVSIAISASDLVMSSQVYPPPAHLIRYLMSLPFPGLYDFYEDKENNLYILNMPLGKKQASMILIMPYHLEPLERLEKLLTRKQVDTWLSKMENRAVAISLPKISLEVSHNLQVKVLPDT